MSLQKKNCPVCGNEFETSRGTESCSRKCGSQLRLKRMDMGAFAAAISAGKTGKTHRGVPHSETTRRVMSEKAHLRMSDPSRNPFIGKKRSDESRAKQSKTRSDRIIAGEYSGWFCRGYIETMKGGRVYYRSSWEKHLVEMLENDQSVLSFKFEPLSIPYYYDEHKRHYIPDVLVRYSDGREVLTEVKPEFFLDAAVNIAKFSAAREFCQKNGWEFRVITQKELGL